MELTTKKTNKNYLIAGLLTIAAAIIIGLLAVIDAGLGFFNTGLNIISHIINGDLRNLILTIFSSQTAVNMGYTVFILATFVMGVLLLFKKRGKYMVFFPIAGMAFGFIAAFGVLIGDMVLKVLFSGIYGLAGIICPLSAFIGYIVLAVSFVPLCITILANGNTDGGKMKIFNWLSAAAVAVGCIFQFVPFITYKISGIIALINNATYDFIYGVIRTLLNLLIDTSIFVIFGEVLLLPLIVFFIASWFIKPYKKSL